MVYLAYTLLGTIRLIMERPELIEHWKSLVWINNIYGQVSLNEMQRISLIELEMDYRKIESEPLNSWYETELANFDEQDFDGAYG